ncbi:dihydrolipoyl dehydrogenase family protein [Prolixibacter denitrificans]|uniref:Dihydrolipoamide dehydrogenase n=1 Tax=Prolixibacter denitrificans TaxID=1541063 RepID=A0A2P8CES8_9BACT|nr:NAD(P)/FAD-dependent oxidoreductase [Prolixibacter denitrificans]PSK83389.1 dihydrolipoamide dehydrogenase [Prolixibacter denitrificans]GET21730.1 dihydrolipoyl dehydrogenase [Prolixibacter denitrificans]
MEKYDLAVIGSGPGGFSAAVRALDFGKDVCLIEAGHVGGAGVMNGALTSKTMWELSHDYAVAAAVDRGYRASGLQVDFTKVKKSVMKAAKTKQYQILSQIETYSQKPGQKGSLTIKYGFASFKDRNTLEIDRGKKEDKETIEADYIIIATGSSPRELPDLKVDQKRIINSDGILNLKKFPERMMIIGSGIIGCEFATIFSNFGHTEVHLLDRAHRVIPFADNDVSDFVSGNLQKNGVVIHHTANLRTVNKKKDYLEVVLDYEDGHSTVIEVDVVLVSIGRDPNTKGLGLENVNIQTTPHGYLKVNEECATGDFDNCNIFAAGDVTGHKALYCVAEEQGRFIVEAIFGELEYPTDYSHMPTLMFFKPEVASVGVNEKILQEKKIPYKAAFYSNEMVNRTIAMRNTNGFVKVLVSDDGRDRILGMQAAGPQASAFIVSVSYLMNSESGMNEVLRSIHPHPSVTEGIQECFRVFNKRSIFKPEAFPDKIKSWAWKPLELQSEKS